MKLLTTRTSRRAQRRRLTLVEVVMAAGLLLILVLGLFAALGSARTAEVFSREHQAASDAAFRILDETAATPFGDLAEGEVAFEVPHGPGSQLRLPPADPGFYPLADDPETAPDESSWPGRLIVREGRHPNDYDADGNADVLELQVVVAWKGASGANELVTAQRLRTRQ